MYIRRYAQTRLQMSAEFMVHGVNFDVGHLFHGVVVLAMVELQRTLGYAPSWN